MDSRARMGRGAWMMLCLAAMLLVGCEGPGDGGAGALVDDATLPDQAGVAAEGDNMALLWDGEELALHGEGVDLFFEDMEGVYSPGFPMRTVGMLLDAHDPEGLAWSAQREDGSWTAWEPAELIWSEGILHVARVRLPFAAEHVRFERGGADILYARIEGVEEAVPDHAIDLPEAFEEEALGGPKSTLMPPGTVTRAEWGARAGTCTSTAALNRMTIHHSATPNNDTSTAPARVRQFQNHHMGLGWCDIGYHFVVGQDGRIYQGRTPPTRIGAHTGGQNTGNIGVALIGNFVSFEPPANMVAKLNEWMCWAVTFYPAIPRNRTSIRGHREWPGQSTACPGNRLEVQLNGLVSNICPPSCSHACSAGARRCTGDGRVETCADHNGNGCRSWGGATGCGGGQVCRGAGTCCTETCTGGRQCASETEYETCADHDGNGCRTFGARASCGEGRGCREAGECYDLWQAEPGKACAEDGECGHARVCRFREAGGFCTLPCEADADCPAESRCAEAGSARFCAPAVESDKEGDEDACRPGLAVWFDDVGGFCGPDCRADEGLCTGNTRCGPTGRCEACVCTPGMCGVLPCGAACGGCGDGERCSSENRCVATPDDGAPAGDEPPGDGDEAGEGGADGPADADASGDGDAGDEADADEAAVDGEGRRGSGVGRVPADGDGAEGSSRSTSSSSGCAAAGSGSSPGGLLVLLGLLVLGMRRRGGPDERPGAVYTGRRLVAVIAAAALALGAGCSGDASSTEDAGDGGEPDASGSAASPDAEGNGDQGGSGGGPGAPPPPPPPERPKADGLCTVCNPVDGCESGPCLEHDGSRFCSRYCGDTVDCPLGYVCERQDDLEGGSAACVPTAGACPDCATPLLLWPDRDGDGYGDARTEPHLSCETREGWVDNGDDCDDDDAEVHPGARLRCDGKDTDCSGEVDGRWSCGCIEVPVDGSEALLCRYLASFEEAVETCASWGLQLGMLRDEERWPETRDAIIEHAALCTDSCGDATGLSLARDGECDDGGPDSATSFCPLGSDCTDCGPRSSTNVWIGLNDIEEEGTFVWLDGSSPAFTDWAPGEPNNHGDGEDCTVIRATEALAGQWNDVPCEREYIFLCTP